MADDSNSTSSILMLSLKGILVGIVIYSGIKFGMKYFHLGAEAKQEKSSEIPVTFCSPLPGIGVSSIVDGGALLRENVHYGNLTLKNEQSLTVVAVLMNMATTKNYQIVTVAPNGKTPIQMPSGQYGLGILSGRDWCNIETGFTNGTRHLINGGVTINPDVTTEAVISTDNGHGNISIDFHNLDPADEHPENNLDIPMSPNGFVTAGGINGNPVAFTVEKDSLGLVLPDWVATKSGVQCTKHVDQIKTFSGYLSGCVGTASEITFGPFSLKNIDVYVVPSGKIIHLGMDILKPFNTIWHDTKLRITPIDSLQKPLSSGPKPEALYAPVMSWDTPPLPRLESIKSPDENKESLFTTMDKVTLVILIGFVISVLMKQERFMKFRENSYVPSSGSGGSSRSSSAVPPK